MLPQTNQKERPGRAFDPKILIQQNPNSADKRLSSIDTPVSTSIDSYSKPKLSLSTKKNMSIDYDFLLPDEFGIFRDQDAMQELFFLGKTMQELWTEGFYKYLEMT